MKVHSVGIQENKRNFSEVNTPTVELSTVDFEQPSTSSQTTKVIESNKPLEDSKQGFNDDLIALIMILKCFLCFRCRSCASCSVSNCGSCKYCLDNPKIGGSGKLKQACSKQRCLSLHYSEKPNVEY